MRTRFITDFFNSTTADTQTLDFLRFPPPDLNSPNLFTFDHLSCFDQFTSIDNTSLDIDTLSSDAALRKFLSDVLPQHTDVKIDQIPTEISPQVKINDVSDGAAKTNLTLVEFETPALHTSLEDSCFLHEEKMQIFFEVMSAEEGSQDLLDFSTEVQQLMDINKSIFYVEDLSLKFHEEHRPDIFEDASLVTGQISSNLRTFPLLEVDETSLGINSYISEDIHMIFETNETQQWMQKDESTCDAKELLLSMEFDLLEHLLNQPPAASDKFEVPCVNFPPGEDIISAIEHPVNEYSLTLGPPEFEKFQFFDMNTSHFSEVFSDAEIINEVEHCQQMFGDTILNTFNSLIVSHELILRDDTFRSLPVPIISDHERVLSVQVIVEELFLKLKPQPSSTSDDIYLDWHFLEEDTFSDNISTSSKMFEDIETCCIDIEMYPGDSQMLILEFVLSDACSDEKTTKENAEVLNIEKSGNLTDPVFPDGTASSNLIDICQKRSSGEAFLDNKVDKSHQLPKSMSQFDDLDFFLHPLETTCMKKQKHVAKKLEMDKSLPLISANCPIEMHHTIQKEWKGSENESIQKQHKFLKNESIQKQHKLLENEFHSSGDFHPTSMLNTDSKHSGPSHSTLVEEKRSMKSLEATQLLFSTKKVNANTTSLPDAIIIVNTQNVDTDMIISRRSTYQRILAMEKGGVQVVERDLNLSVDVILSAAVCLVLYDIKNIRRKTAASDNASSFLPSCVENIAANVLTSLSFAFSSCILIFEGEVGFLACVMELSDELYVAAASLGIDLQLFYSYSSETTNEIILNSIAHAAKSTRGLYPRMPESETLAESFLSKFPSLNPLSAHAILSSVGTLVEFFEMTHKQRVCALQKYLVPDASITLFSALSRYGEREDSRSGMTDCCSSVSSGHDSGNCCPNELKKRKYPGSPETKAIPVDDLLQFEQSNVTWDFPKVDSHNYWNLNTEEIPDDIGNSNRGFDKIYAGEKQRSDPCMKMNRPSFSETSFGQSKKVHLPIVDKSVGHTNYNSKGLVEGYKGEVIDVDDDDAIAVENFSFVNPTHLSSGWCSLPTFPTAAEISSDLDSWIPTKDNGKSLSAEVTLNSHIDLMNNCTPLEECSLVNSTVNFSMPPFEEKDPLYGRTPLSKAILSAQPQKGSPWTIDFLNRMKEKRKMRQQSLPNISSAPCFGHSENSPNFRKRKSPSILDLYRYQQSSTVQGLEHKRRHVFTQPSSSSKAVKGTASLQSRTPIDKRAKRKLTFATNGSKGQSRLVWSDKIDQTMQGRL
uniref:protein SHORTAGE IN CHIASMATA 1 n=1 Tax=Erigeron canadensis TaxID=72917 RepID=UPI001CB8D48B|nr:protein SHORTAGE IN CHIASMATA 1 [Erigeron canadensis]